MAKFFKADSGVVEIAEHMINLYHEDLKEARIGLLFRDEAPVSDGRVTLGAAKKIGDEMKPYMQYDFVIWVAQDYWYRLDVKQKQALIDHELCHCSFENRKAATRKHDIEEFTCILERHGMWYPKFLSPEIYTRAFQAALWSGEGGKVEAMDGELLRRSVNEAFADTEGVAVEWLK